MDKDSVFRVRATRLGDGRAGAEGPLALAPGRAERGLDLSLGHIGTLSAGDESEVDVVSFGPYTLTLVYDRLRGWVELDPLVVVSRQERRGSLRSLEKLIRVAEKSGMTIDRDDLNPVTLDVRSEDLQ